jgi:AraC-like DNA-binding protein
MSELTAWDIEHAMEDEREYELYHNCSNRRTTPEFHSHDFYEFYFFISGDASLYIEEYAYRMKPGDVFIIPPGRMHRAFFHNTEAYYERMFVYISRNALKDMGSADFSLIGIIDDCIRRSQFRFSLSDSDFTACRYTISEIVSDAVGAPAHQRLINRCKLTILMTRLCKLFGEVRDEHSSRSGKRVADVIAYINEHIGQDLSLDEVSSRFFISKYHLIREFKNYTNRSVYQYIVAKRIIQAKLLMQSGIAPTDAYLQCGFREYSSFYKAFKKETALSPQQYISCLSSSALRISNPDVQ